MPTITKLQAEILELNKVNGCNDTFHSVITISITAGCLVGGPRVLEAGLCGCTAADGLPRPSVDAMALRDRLRSIRSAVAVARLTSSGWPALG